MAEWLARDELPTSLVTDSGNEYSVDTDFRAWIRFQEIIEDKNILDNFKALFCARVVGLDINVFEYEPTDAVLNAMLAFFLCFREPKAPQKQTSDIAYRYKEDWGLICAAFRQQYGINLLTADMHWFYYKSLFDALTSDTMFVKIQQYRTADIAKLPKYERKEALRLKNYWKINDTKVVFQKTPQEIEKELLQKIKTGK